MKSSIPLCFISLVLILYFFHITSGEYPPSDDVLREISPPEEILEVFGEILTSPKPVVKNRGKTHCLSFIWWDVIGKQVVSSSQSEDETIEICIDLDDPHLWQVNPEVKSSRDLRHAHPESFVNYVPKSDPRGERYWDITATLLHRTDTEVTLKFSATKYRVDISVDGMQFWSEQVKFPFRFGEKQDTIDLRKDDGTGKMTPQMVPIDIGVCPASQKMQTIFLGLSALYKKTLKVPTGQSTDTRVTQEQIAAVSSLTFPIYTLTHPAMINNLRDSSSVHVTRDGSAFAYGTCTGKGSHSTATSPTQDKFLKQLFYSPHFHNCGDDEYLHLSYTLPEGKGTEVVMVVADGVGGSRDEGKDPGLLTLNMMKILYRFISLYPGWSPLDYLGVLIPFLNTKPEILADFKGMFHYIFSQGHEADSPSTTQYWAKYLDVYMNHLGQGSSTLSMFKYNTNTYSFSYANIGDSGFIVLRKDNDDYYKVVMKSNRGQVVANTPFQIEMKSNGVVSFITRVHSDDENDKKVRYGVLFDSGFTYLSEETQKNLRASLRQSEHTHTSHLTMMNVLPENSPASNLPKLQRGDVIIGASDGLLDNLHDVEVEAHVTLAARNLPPNGNGGEGTSSDPRQRLQKEIAEVLKRVVLTQMRHEKNKAETLRENYLANLSTELPKHLPLSKINFLKPIPFATPRGKIRFQKEDDLTIVVSVVP